MLAMALTGVPTSELEQLLRLVHRKQVELPLSPVALACVGLQHRSEEFMHIMRGLDEAGVRAVLIAVIAERREASSSRGA